MEVIDSISRNKVDELKGSLNSPNLWEISRGFGGVTFFLYTDQQVKNYKESKMIKEWSDKFFSLLEPYNEFGYFKRKEFLISLDSKENFDNNYESNWFYYYK